MSSDTKAAMDQISDQSKDHSQHYPFHLPVSEPLVYTKTGNNTHNAYNNNGQASKKTALSQWTDVFIVSISQGSKVGTDCRFVL